jgi:hypothetical protein
MSAYGNATVIPFPPNNETFLRAAFGPDWERVKVTMFLGDPTRQPRDAWMGYPAVDMLKAPHHHLNVYYSVGLQTGSSRGLAGFEAIHVIVLDDVDEAGTKVDLDRAIELLGTTPNYILETSPGNFQVGWFVEPIRDRAWAMSLVKALYQALGCQADNLKNTVTLVRLPVGTNGKAAWGPKGFRSRLVHWAPGGRVTHAELQEVEARIGQVFVAQPRLSQHVAIPDPGEIEMDAVLQAFRLLGKVQGHGRVMTMGWGFDVECPWVEEHTARATTGTSYVPVHGRFHCHHGHCQDRDMGEVRERLDQLLREQSGGVMSIAALEFDAVDPKAISLATIAATAQPGKAISLWDQKPAPAWPGGIFPGPVEDTLAEVAERDGLDLGAMGAAMLTAGSGAADKRTLLQPYQGSEWMVRPVLWLLLVAETGQRKSGVFQYVLRRLQQVNAERMQRYAREMARWRARPVAQKPDPAPEVAALLAEDTTVEKLQDWMAGNPRGLLCLRDEIAGLLAFGRYASGSGAAERAFYLETYDGGPTTIGRMSRTTAIANCAMSLIGAIQQHRLLDFPDLANDGFLSRLGPVIMDEARTAGTSGTTPPSLTTIDSTFDRLLRNGAFGVYRTDAAGEELIRDTERLGDVMGQRQDTGVGFRGFMRKLHGVHARTALVLHLMDGGQDDVVPAETVARARRYAQFLYQHAEVFYAGLTGQSEITKAIGSYLLRHAPTRVTAGQLRRDIAACKPLRSDKEIQEAVWVLVISGWLKPETQWPSNRAWLVRPGLQDQFAERLALEVQRVEAVKAAMNHLGRYQ